MADAGSATEIAAAIGTFAGAAAVSLARHAYKSWRAKKSDARNEQGEQDEGRVNTSTYEMAELRLQLAMGASRLVEAAGRIEMLEKTLRDSERNLRASRDQRAHLVAERAQLVAERAQLLAEVRTAREERARLLAEGENHRTRIAELEEQLRRTQDLVEKPETSQ